MPMRDARVAILFGLVFCCSLAASTVGAQDSNEVETLFQKLGSAYSASQESKDAILKRLEAQKPSFTPAQNERYMLAYVHSLGDHGNHAERVELAETFIRQALSASRRAQFLYEIIDGNANLGRYEHALLAMNESILLLPQIDKTPVKIVVLQGAINLLTPMRAYDDAMDFSARIQIMGKETGSPYAVCVGLANRVEINYLRQASEPLQQDVPKALAACREANHELTTLIIRSLDAMHVIDSGNHVRGISLVLPLLQEFTATNQNSDYVPQLHEALARAYLQTGNLQRAEYYGQRAFDRAQAGRVLLLQEKTSETLAAIKRAQGQLPAALALLDINLDLKKRVLSDQVQKNLAYQRVKFDTQDKANQLTLLEQRNQNLRMEKELHERQNENLILLLTLGLVLVVSLGGWLARVLSRMDRFRLSAQTDALTRVSNRAHFVAETTKALQQSARAVSLVVFDMDHFKHINDTYGHPTGDWVLQAVCETVKLQLDKGDVFGRLGGEEFALCVPDLAPDAVMTLAERCRIAILSIDTRPSGYSFAITSSFGVATRAAGETVPYEQMLVAADKALYVSKNNGRNRVTVYHPTAASAASIA